jgi:hypothetical protein
MGYHVTCSFMSVWNLVSYRKGRTGGGGGQIKVLRKMYGRINREQVRGFIQKFPDRPPGARTANGTDPCH